MMQRHETRRKPVMVRLTDEQLAVLDEHADAHHDGNRSEAIRDLLAKGAKAIGRASRWRA